MYVLSNAGNLMVNIKDADYLSVSKTSGGIFLSITKGGKNYEFGPYEKGEKALKDLRRIFDIFRAGGKVADLAESDGKWTLASDGDGIVCSVCGADFCTIVHETERFHYCPNCGAKMSGEGLGC